MAGVLIVSLQDSLGYVLADHVGRLVMSECSMVHSSGELNGMLVLTL